jgi:hypothetical protein
MRRTALPLLFLLMLASFAAAQTTYYSPSPFRCDAASLHPVVSFYQFSCRGIKLADSTGNIVGSFFLFSNEAVQVALPNIPYPPDIFDSYVTKVDFFTTPSDGNPGTISFDWQVEDANGVFHTGTASGTWVDYVICGGRGCQWHAPKLLTFTTTAD